MTRLRIVFDLDDTLYPERSYALSGFRASAAWAKRTHGLSDLDRELEHFLDQGHLGQSFRLALEQRLPGYTAGDLEAIVAAYRTHEPDIALFEDARWALDHYEAQGPLGLLTDGNVESQSRKVKALALEPRFREIVYTGALGREFRKPHPRPFEVMAASLAEPGTTLVYVGDNPARDFVSPNRMGWLTVQVVRAGGIHDGAARIAGGDPQFTVASLRELPEALGR
ncbi:MAG: HAD family hydrolase [Hyphomicrobiaceae bacterium]|nr:HAD family hydrolase [Hyphomicrobiaceae bacterium]